MVGICKYLLDLKPQASVPRQQAIVEGLKCFVRLNVETTYRDTVQHLIVQADKTFF